jgi:hypothetical protein
MRKAHPASPPAPAPVPSEAGARVGGKVSFRGGRRVEPLAGGTGEAGTVMVRRVAEFDRVFLGNGGRAGTVGVLESFARSRSPLSEQLAQGKVIRQDVARSSHADFVPRPDRLVCFGAQNWL